MEDRLGPSNLCPPMRGQWNRTGTVACLVPPQYVRFCSVAVISNVNLCK